MLAVADAAVVQAVEAEGVDVRMLLKNLGQHVDEEVAVRPERAEHAAVAELFHVDLRNGRRVGGDAPPVGMAFVDFALQRRRIDAEDANAEPLVFGDLFLQPVERHVRAALLEQFAVVVRIERIDEIQLADRHAVLDRFGSLSGIHAGERVADADGVLHPIGYADGRWLSHHGKRRNRQKHDEGKMILRHG